MVRDDKINIKIEVCRDKTSGKLSIMARFNENAPNIFQEKGDYFWIPTPEEKDFLNEAFALVPLDTSHINSNITTPKLGEEREVKVEPELEPEIPDEKPEVPPLEKTEKPSIFEEPTLDNKPIGTENEAEMPNEDIPTKSDEPIGMEELEKPEEHDFDELDPEESEDDTGIIVEADADAIDKALKRHTLKDKTIVEADEQTIVDKVLSQKKKGKWNKR
jgi:hypothetical protein